MYDTATQNPPVAAVDGAGVLWPENATPDELREIIRRFDRDLTEMRQINATRLSELERARQRVEEVQNRYRHDMQHWESTMRGQKDEMNWCDEGTNKVIRILNDGFTGGWEIDEYSEIVEAEVTIRGEVVTTITVHVKDGDDPDDPENWVDEDGDSVDHDSIAESALGDEYRRNGWDEWDVSY